MRKCIRKLLPYAPYIFLSLIVLGPLLLPGFVLTMDMVFTPVLRLPDHVDNTWAFYALLHVLNIVLPADFIQKIVLLAILLLSSAGAHRLLVQLRPSGEKYWLLAVYIGATLYMINPFVYVHFMAGQYGILLGYGLQPWFALQLWRFVRQPDAKGAVFLACWVAAMSIVSIHSLGWVVVLSLCAIIVHARDAEKLRRVAKYGALSIIFFAIVSAYWLVPTMLGHGRIADSLGTFSASERLAFATVDTNGTTALGAVLGLQGFWQDDRQLYILPIDATPQWGWFQVAFLAVIAVGVAVSLKVQRRLALYGIGVTIVACALALGVGGDWLVRHVPFFAGFREPQKFVALIALAYAYFATWGAVWLVGKAASWLQWARYAVIGLLVVLVLGYTSAMLWGLDGQIQPTHYPADWFTANRLLDAQPGNARVLFLPWHLYMAYSFSGRIIASPAAGFFDRPVVASDDPELPGVAPQTHNAVREAIQASILPEGAKGQQIAAKLRALNIGYVLVAKDLDWKHYDWLNHQTGLTLLRDMPTLRVYRLTK